MPAQQPGVMQRRHSSASSSDAASDHGMNSRNTSQENISLIPTRTAKVATSKPAANPLQFIKVGPCDLYRSAQEQLKKVEEVKKVKKEKRDEAEDWQSNLDNWKCSRRKRQEHIIERVVEVKKFELEEFDRNRRRSKTFSEMMEERNSKGRKLSLPVYNDDGNDLSELGLGSSKSSKAVSQTNGDDSVFDEILEDIGSDAASSQEISNSVKQNGLGVNGHSVEEKLNSNDTEEYTYERAIQSYVNFTESRVRGRSLTPSSEDAKMCNGFSKKSSPPVPVKPRRNSCKIEEKLSELEEFKKKSVSTTDLNNDSGKRSISVPKVDISKRRELFEKSVEEEQNTKLNRLSGDFGSSRSIRERLSSLGKQPEDISLGSTKKLNGLSSEISVKDRLTSIEKNQSIDNVSNTVKVNRISSEAGQQSVRDRLSSLQKETPIDKVPRNRVPSEISSIKDRLTSLDAACNKEIPRTVVPKQEIIGTKKDEFHEQEKKFKDESFDRAFSPEEEIYESKRQQHYRHRSLDSLDVDSTDGLGNESFERVQSLEDLDFCRNYPASSLSGDTDREDSGINTADVSSSVSQADDCDLHLDDDIKLHHQPAIMEELPKQTIQETKTECNNLIKENETQKIQKSVSCIPEVKELTDYDTGTVVVESPSCFLKLPLRLELDPLPVILESPSEPYPAFDIIDKINEKIQPEENVCDQNSSSPLDNITIESKSDTEIKHINQSDNRNTDISSIENIISNACLDSSPINVEDSIVSNILPNSSPNNNEDFNMSNALPDSCPNNIVNTAEPCNEDSASGSPLSISNVSMDVSEVCMQDETACSDSGVGDNKRKTVVEICHKIDSSELKSPLPTPYISVDTDFNFNSQEKFEEDSLEMSDNLLQDLPGEKDLNTDSKFVEEKTLPHFQVLTVDIAKKDDVNIFPISGEMNLQKSAETLLAVDNLDKSTIDTIIVNNTMNKPDTLYINNEFNLNQDVVFPLSPSTLEPPKEKPPPPPTETSDDDDGSLNEKSSPLRRLDSTKRIKKEIRQKRSSFLGLNDGLEDESYLEPELEVRPPPDMTTFLAEERRLEQMMYRQSICSESDSNQESRDSGVELEKHPDDLTWSRLHHSRDNSETFGNTSTTSEEEEIIKKEREIIEILEQEELNRYQTNSQNDQDNIGEKLALRLRELEQEKSRLEWERHEEVARRRAVENERNEHENRIQAREQELRKQENVVDNTVLDEETVFENDNQHLSMEMLLSEREHLEKEQEALKRQRESIMQQQWSSSMQDISVTQQNTIAQEVQGVPVPNYRQSLINVNSQSQADYRQSMPDLATIQPRRPPPPIPPSKPLISQRNQEKRTSSPQQMSRQTIQALSAAPRSRLISNDNWMQTKRKPKVIQDNNYNYQHWLIQEAEHRRITEQNQRQAPPVRRPQSHSQTGPWPQNGTSQYTNWQPQQQKAIHWASPPQEQQQNSHWASPPQQSQHQQNLQWTHQQPQTTQRPSPPQQQQQWVSTQPPQHHPTAQPRTDKPLPDSIIQTLTQRVQNRINSSDTNNNRRRVEPSPVVESRPQSGSENQEKMLSVSGKKKCSHCGDELGRGAAMIIESLRLFYHINCFKCCVCCVQLGDGLMGTDVRVRNNKLHCHNCYSSDDGVKFSCV